jgi:hypothetical protein
MIEQMFLVVKRFVAGGTRQAARSMSSRPSVVGGQRAAGGGRLERVAAVWVCAEEVFSMARRGGVKRRLQRERQARRAQAAQLMAQEAAGLPGLAVRPEGLWEDGAVAMDPAQVAWLEQGVPEDMPSPNAPLEERRAWILEREGPGAFSAEVLEEMKERSCAMPDCGGRAVSRSLFCGYHQKSAVGEAGARELRALNREMERLGRITDSQKKRAAVGRFRKRVERGDFAILFSGKMQKTIERAAEDAELAMELGSVRVALALAIQEIDDPKELSLAVSRLANASARTTRASVARKREQRQGAGG